MSIRPKSKYNLAFGRVLAALRKKSGWSQEALGFEADMDRSFISLLERGKRSPTLDTIVTLAHALGLSLTQLSSLVEAQLERMDDQSSVDPS